MYHVMWWSIGGVAMSCIALASGQEDFVGVTSIISGGTEGNEAAELVDEAIITTPEDHFFCGRDWADASTDCDAKKPCPSGSDDECDVSAPVCFGDTACNAALGHGSMYKFLGRPYADPRNSLFCAQDWKDAETVCDLEKWCGDTGVCDGDLSCFPSTCNVQDLVRPEGYQDEGEEESGTYSLSDPKRSNFCGINWGAASDACDVWCPEGTECSQGMSCFADTTCYYDRDIVPSANPTVTYDAPPNMQFCGESWGEAGENCSIDTHCPNGDIDCPPGQTCVGYLYTCNIVDMLKKDKRPTQPPETRAPVVQTNVPSRRPVTPAPIETSEPSRFEMQWVDPDEEDWGDPDEEEEDWGDPDEEEEDWGDPDEEEEDWGDPDEEEEDWGDPPLSPTSERTVPPTPKPSRRPLSARPTPLPTVESTDSFFCGHDINHASASCRKRCRSGRRQECEGGELCFKYTSCTEVKYTASENILGSIIGTKPAEEPQPNPTIAGSTSNIGVRQNYCAESRGSLDVGCIYATTCNFGDLCPVGQFCFGDHLCTGSKKKQTLKPTYHPTSATYAPTLATYTPTDDKNTYEFYCASSLEDLEASYKSAPSCRDGPCKGGLFCFPFRGPSSSTNISPTPAPQATAKPIAPSQQPTTEAVIAAKPNEPLIQQEEMVIGGYSFYDSNGDGIRQGSDLGVSQVRVSLFACSSADRQRIASSETNTRGFFAFDLPTPGNYQLSVQPPPGFTFSSVVSSGADNVVNRATGTSDCFEVSAGTRDLDKYIGLVESTFGLYTLTPTRRPTRNPVTSHPTPRPSPKEPELYCAAAQEDLKETCITAQSCAKSSCPKGQFCTQFDCPARFERYCASNVKELEESCGLATPCKNDLACRNGKTCIHFECKQRLDLCPLNFDGMHSSPDCREYFHCKGGFVSSKIQTCGVGLLFDKGRNECVRANQVDQFCYSKPDETSIMCPNGFVGWQASYGDCLEYYQCNEDGSTGPVRTCRVGLKFDKVRSECVDGTTVNDFCYGPPAILSAKPPASTPLPTAKPFSVEISAEQDFLCAKTMEELETSYKIAPSCRDGPCDPGMFCFPFNIPSPDSPSGTLTLSFPYNELNPDSSSGTVGEAKLYCAFSIEALETTPCAVLKSCETNSACPPGQLCLPFSCGDSEQSKPAPKPAPTTVGISFENTIEYPWSRTATPTVGNNSSEIPPWYSSTIVDISSAWQQKTTLFSHIMSLFCLHMVIGL